MLNKNLRDCFLHHYLMYTAYWMFESNPSVLKMCFQTLLSVSGRNGTTAVTSVLSLQVWRNCCHLCSCMPLHHLLSHRACTDQHQLVVRKFAINQNISCFSGVTVLLLLYWLLTLKWITFNTFCPANNRFNSPAFGFLLQACSGFPTRLLRLHPRTAGLAVTAVLIMSTSPLALCCIKLESYSTQSWSCRNPARLQAPVRTVLREVTQCSSADSVRTLHLKQF